MNKKKFDLKLTAFLVSLFIGFLLLILGNKNTYCLSFGFIVLAGSLALYAMYKINKLKEMQAEAEQAMEETPLEDTYALKELYQLKTKIKKNMRSIAIVFYLTAVLLFVLGVANLF